MILLCFTYFLSVLDLLWNNHSNHFKQLVYTALNISLKRWFETLADCPKSLQFYVNKDI